MLKNRVSDNSHVPLQNTLHHCCGSQFHPNFNQFNAGATGQHPVWPCILFISYPGDSSVTL